MVMPTLKQGYTLLLVPESASTLPQMHWRRILEHVQSLLLNEMQHLSLPRRHPFRLETRCPR